MAAFHHHALSVRSCTRLPSPAMLRCVVCHAAYAHVSLACWATVRIRDHRSHACAGGGWTSAASRRTASRHASSSPILSCPALSSPVRSYPILSYHFLSDDFTSKTYPTLLDKVKPCHAMHHTMPSHAISCPLPMTRQIMSTYFSTAHQIRGTSFV